MISRLDLYKVFYEVGEHKSFSKAAKALYMTQPAVSQSIMQLERELDTRVFTRTSKGVMLTNEGQLLFEYISSAINLIKAGEEKLLETKNLMIGELKIGVGDTISRYFLLPYLEKFHEKYPNIKFKIVNSTTLELCDILKSGKIDIAICNFPIEDTALERKICMDIHDIFVCGEKYRNVTAEAIGFQEIVKLPLILLDSDSNSRQCVEKYILSRGFKITPEIELGSHDLILEFAKINLGVGCVIKEFSQEYLQNGTLYEVKTLEEIPSRSIGYCFLKSVSLSPAAAKFVEILEEVYEV